MTVAARKKRDDGNGNGLSRAVGVLVENMQGQFKAFGERLQGMDERMQAMDGRMQGMDERMQAMDGRMQGMDQRMTVGFARVEQRQDAVERQLGTVVVDLGLVKTAVLDNSRVLQEHGRLLKDVVRRDEVDALVERAVARSAR